MSKIQMAKAVLEKNIQIIHCPLCKSGLNFENDYTVVCEKRHSFDLSSKGYVNFFPGAKKGYSKELFRERQQVCQKGFFDQLLVSIEQLVLEHEHKYILDAGCGEGSHLNFLTGNRNKATGIGVDISKEGIALCQKTANNLWLVADLANLPIKNNTIDVVLNILSPASYAEFGRILKKGGLIIKVVPGVEYLKELREFFYEQKAYDPFRVPKYSEERIKLLGQKNIYYKFKTDDILEKIINMTPLSSNISAAKKLELLQYGLPEITVDFQILWGCINA